MNIRVKSLSHYGFVSGRREVSGGQMEAQILCSQCAEMGNGSEVPGGGIRCQNLPNGFVLLGCRRAAGILM